MKNNVATALIYQIKSEAILNEFKTRLKNDYSFNTASFFDLLDSGSKGYISAFDLVKILHNEGFTDTLETHLIFFIQPFFKNKASHKEVYTKDGKLKILFFH